MLLDLTYFCIIELSYDFNFSLHKYLVRNYFLHFFFRRIHSGEKPHACSLCGKRFTASSNLYYHKMTHNKVLYSRVRNCRLSTETPDYQLGLAILAARRLLESTLSSNFFLIQNGNLKKLSF